MAPDIHMRDIRFRFDILSVQMNSLNIDMFYFILEC